MSWNHKWLWIWVLLSIPTAIVGFFVLFGAATFWNMHQVQKLCAALPPGTPYAKIRPAIEKYGLWNGLVSYQFEHEDTREVSRGKWNIAVPAVMTYGDMECSIWHDHAVVVRAEVLD